MAPETPITQYIADLSAGDRSAADRLLPHVYEELRKLAISFFQQQPGHHTLQPTALVHEAYVKLVGSGSAGWESRKHFFDVAAMAMRQLLADHARRKASLKRGGDIARVTLIDSDGAFAPEAGAATTPGGAPDLDVEALDAALTKLAALDPRQGRIVELRYLAGLTTDQTADVLGISERTVRLEWQTARAWLRRELAG
ncbi:MAG: sigma-70 family RNA polymerase sigma factor [Phycisphaerales bacterium]|nr:sigma-70 family RNA polymerase sigma factor [Phycisphaerales bacterium]